MRLQLLSDLHLETEVYAPEPAPDAELLVLAGDVDGTWAGLERFRDWPVPILCIAGNHEFDGRDLVSAWPQLRRRCEQLGMTFLEQESVVLTDATGRRIRFVGTIRWSDFDLFGTKGREKAMRAAGYFLSIMRTTRHGAPLDAPTMREESLACRRWLAAELARSPTAESAWDATVAITHFAPSVRSADPRYGTQASTASFCNNDDDLLPFADVWIHGHLHCRQDYRAEHASGSTRVVANPRGHTKNGESIDYPGRFVIDV